jgi:hypothetical protein
MIQIRGTGSRAGHPRGRSPPPRTPRRLRGGHDDQPAERSDDLGSCPSYARSDGDSRGTINEHGRMSLTVERNGSQLTLRHGPLLCAAVFGPLDKACMAPVAHQDHLVSRPMPFLAPPGTNRVQTAPPNAGQRRPTSPNVPAGHRPSRRSKPWPAFPQRRYISKRSRGLPKLCPRRRAGLRWSRPRSRRSEPAHPRHASSGWGNASLGVDLRPVAR